MAERLRPFRKQVRTGNLRLRVALEEEILTQDATGGQSAAWTERVKLWADIEELSAAQRFFGGQLMALASHRVTIRWPGLLTNFSATAEELSDKFRIVYGKRYFKIIAVLDRGDIIELLCMEELPKI